MQVSLYKNVSELHDMHTLLEVQFKQFMEHD